MKTTVLDPMVQAKALTIAVLSQADLLYPGKRQWLSREYHLRNGIFSRV